MENRGERNEYVIGKDGRPLVDRYGRPVRRRDAGGAGAGSGASRGASRETAYEPRRTPNDARRAERQNRPEPAPAKPRQIMPGERSAARPVQSRPVQRNVERRAPEPGYRSERQPEYQPEYQDVPMQVQSRPQMQQAPRRKPARRRRRGCASGCSLAILAVLVLVIASVFVTDSRLGRVQAMPDEQVANTSGTNWLLVGSDSRAGLSQEEVDRLGTGGDLGSTRTDTVMLLHIPRSGAATLISIPRDSYVEIPGWGYDKINVAFSVGGAPLLVQTVEQSTGLRVDRYAEIGMGGLANVVDAVGGVEICVAEPIEDPLANLYVQPGCQLMDGATGLGYVRTRATALGDLDRVARQREFLGALVAKVMSPSTLLNPFRIIPLAWTLPTLFVVGQGDHVWNLARIAFAMRSGLETETVPLGGFMDTEVGSVVLWDEGAAAELFDRLR